MNSSTTIICRPATPGDVDVITDFNCRLAFETESLTLDSDIVRRGVARSLQLSPEAQYFVAVVNSDVVGQLMLTREWSDWRNGWIVWLQSVYVDERFRKAGVFRELFRFVRRRLAEQPDVVGIRLYVESENAAALGTYSRLGFRQSGYLVLEMSDD
ncbi:MAG: GNAT family N-acetyltransferase [Planctomycetaceae bacterium]